MMTDPQGRGQAPRALLSFAVAALVLALAGTRLHRSPYVASNLSVVPDTVEYAVCAQRFATLGVYDLPIDGVSYPPHSPPWFSTVFLSPAYFAAPDELGAGIVVVLAFALAGVLAAFLIGRRLAGEWGGAAAAVALAANGVYRTYSREIMTDVPAVALALWAWWLFARIRERERPLREWALAGILCAAAQAIRSESLALYLPFAWAAWRARERLLPPLLALGIPCAAVLVATGLYHHATFGDFRRTGYQFWTPVPWDYRELLFSTAYLGQNLRAWIEPWILPALALGVAGTGVLALRREQELRPALGFLAFAAGIPSLAHLVFFFTAARFHLPAIAGLCVLGGAGVAALVPARVRHRLPALAIAIPWLLLALPSRPDDPPVRRIVADVLAAETSADAVIVSGIDPVCLEPIVLRGTSRRIVPVSRNVEYASKAVAWNRIPRLDPPPSGPLDHRAPGLFVGGAMDVIEFTADEAPDRLAEIVRSGRLVYVESMYVPAGFSLRGLLGRDLVAEPHPEHRWLARLRLRE